MKYVKYAYFFAAALPIWMAATNGITDSELVNWPIIRWVNLVITAGFAGFLNYVAYRQSQINGTKAPQLPSPDSVSK